MTKAAEHGPVVITVADDANPLRVAVATLKAHMDSCPCPEHRALAPVIDLFNQLTIEERLLLLLFVDAGMIQVLPPNDERPPPGTTEH